MNLKETAQIIWRGFAMGAADIVPGVSGGTVAFITGIYERLINALAACTPASLLIWYRQGFRAFVAHTDLYFLLTLFASIAIAAKLFAGVVIFLLLNYTQLVWAFFSGLILATVWMLMKMLGRPRLREGIAALLGCLLVIFIARYLSAELPATPLVFFLSGFVAICAMILPGISGSAILLVVGVYPHFLSAIDNSEVLLIGAFLAGCVSGLMSFSRLLRYVFKRFYRTSIASIAGLLAGSLYVTWPFKRFTDVSSVESLGNAANLGLLETLEAITLIDTVSTLIAIVIGCVVIVASERFSGQASI